MMGLAAEMPHTFQDMVFPSHYRQHNSYWVKCPVFQLRCEVHMRSCGTVVKRPICQLTFCSYITPKRQSHNLRPHLQFPEQEIHMHMLTFICACSC